MHVDKKGVKLFFHLSFCVTVLKSVEVLSTDDV